MAKGKLCVKRVEKLKKDGKGTYEVVILSLKTEDNKEYELSKYFPNDIAKGLLNTYEIEIQKELI